MVLLRALDREILRTAHRDLHPFSISQTRIQTPAASVGLDHCSVRCSTHLHPSQRVAVTELDYTVLKEGIDEVKPTSYIEIGTGKGVSATHVFNYLQEHFPQCHFYTLEIFPQHYDEIQDTKELAPYFEIMENGPLLTEWIKKLDKQKASTKRTQKIYLEVAKELDELEILLIDRPTTKQETKKHIITIQKLIKKLENSMKESLKEHGK